MQTGTPVNPAALLFAPRIRLVQYWECSKNSPFFMNLWRFRALRRRTRERIRKPSRQGLCDRHGYLTLVANSTVPEKPCFDFLYIFQTV